MLAFYWLENWQQHNIMFYYQSNILPIYCKLQRWHSTDWKIDSSTMLCFTIKVTYYLYTVNSIEKTKVKIKQVANGPFFNQNLCFMSLKSVKCLKQTNYLSKYYNPRCHSPLGRSTVWPDWAIYWATFSNLWQQFIYPNLPHS